MRFEFKYHRTHPHSPKNAHARKCTSTHTRKHTCSQKLLIMHMQETGDVMFAWWFLMSFIHWRQQLDSDYSHITRTISTHLIMCSITLSHNLSVFHHVKSNRPCKTHITSQNYRDTFYQQAEIRPIACQEQNQPGV